MTEVLEGVKAQGANALDAFKAQAGAHGLSCEARLMQGMSEEFPHDFAYAARHADLTILGQPRDGDPLIGQYALVERCLFASGRPVIIVPAAAEALSPNGTVVAAWDGSAEAARAINDAMAFLKPATRVVLLVGIMIEGDDGEGAPQTEAMVAHLKRHGVTAEVVRVKVSQGDVGRLLLSSAKDLGADLMVMGAFHHSRWREFILGGVTLTVLEEATIPLFMAH
jgi:nucleotide-binding universal stress UspA family protein